MGIFGVDGLFLGMIFTTNASLIASIIKVSLTGETQKMFFQGKKPLKTW